MTKSNTNKFKRVMCGLLSTLTVLSGTAVAGTAAVTTASAAEVETETSAANENDPATFSWDNASVYFLLTDRFCNGDTSNDHSYGRGLTQNGSVANFDNYGAFQGGDFAGVTKKINEGYFDDLGVNAIWLSAPYEQIHGYCIGCDGDSFAHYSYHGYYVLDYTESDKNFGTKEEFKELVDTAHEHGIRIVMDIVMNHTGYNTIQDMSEYGFGSLKNGWESYYYGYRNINNTDYHGYIDYDASADVWAKWWGPSWIRCGLPGYTTGSGDIEGSLAGLPDFKTGDNSSVGLPQILKTKWEKEGTYSTKSVKYGNDNVTGYISTWLAEWVSEYGVDGFRCDTAKHVELSSWKTLKTKCVAALKEWKQNNPDKKLDDLDFWMTGECFGHKAEKSQYFTQGGFDSMINFEFAPAVNSSNIPSAASVDSVYSRYANSINSDPEFNVLTYLASHDTTLIQGDRNYAGSFLLMCPGGIQIYYGDETNRPIINSQFAQIDPGAGHQYRSFMNWDSADQNTLSHWQKVGTFRNNHIAVGAGSHNVISAYDSSNGYTFSRTYNKDDIQDTIVATLFAQANKNVTIDVSSVWSDGIEITNFYDGTTCKVSGGKVTFNTGANGTILMQEPQGAKGKVIVTHINQDTGATIKTETLAGLLGDPYTATPLDTEGYKLSKTVGSKTGTYSETDGSVTFYYTFDSSNYAYISVKYVDAATGAEISESDTLVGKVGSSYTTEAKSIKNYEVDTIPSNASGTVKSGTTTVTYKYNYVEPSNLQVHYYNANNWPSVNLYAYTEVGSVATEYTGKWPGTAMTAESDGWFYCDVPDTENGLVIFNNGGTAQEPGQKQPGYGATGEVWVKSGTVYPTGKVNVKYVSTDGKVLGSDVVKGMADGTTKYTTTAKQFSNYTLSSTPSNASGTFTENAVTVTYTYTPDTPVYDDLVNNSTVNKTSLKVGDTLTITGNANGGTGSYKYAFYYQRTTASSWQTLGTAFGTAKSATLTPASAGTFNIKVVVKDGNNTTAEKTFKVTFSEPDSTLTNNSKVSSTKLSLGQTLTITGAATGGTGSYKYAYYYKRAENSTWRVLGTEFGTATTATLTPTGAATFDIKVIVKDGANTTSTKTFQVSVVSNPLVNSSTVSTAKLTVGNTLTITGAASGGSGSYKYAFYYKRSENSVWRVLGTEYGTATKATLTPTGAASFDIKVIVKDTAGTTTERTFNVIAVNPTQPLTNKSTVSSTNLTLGTTLTIKGAATGGSGAYEYAFFYKRSTSETWITLGTQFGTATTATLKPTGAATFDIKVVVRDKNDYKSTSRSLFTVVVSSGVLTNKSTVSTTNLKLGSKLTIKGSATGGSGAYEYAFFYKRTTSSNWITLGTQFGTATTATLTPTGVATFDIKVVVRDKNDYSKTSRSLFTVNVTSAGALTNNSSVASTSVKLGNAVTLKGAASGGTGSYKYAYYYKRTTSNNWIVIGTEYGTATSASFTPVSAGNFDLMVKVMDSSGEVVSKTFAASVK